MVRGALGAEPPAAPKAGGELVRAAGTDDPLARAGLASTAPSTPLGKNTKSPSPTIIREKRAARYKLREVLSDVTRARRVGACGWRRITSVAEPEVRIKQQVAHFAGVQLCGNIWLCPVCGPYIRQQRAVEVDRACSWWLHHFGVGTVMLLTLTLPHDANDSLRSVLDAVRAAFSALVAGKGWQMDKSRFGLAHYIRAHDCTHGNNGWHFHVHVLLFGERRLSRDELMALQGALHRRWSGAVTRCGFRQPSEEHGVRLEQARTGSDIARYVCQVIVGNNEDRPRAVAFEVARGDLKTSRHDGHRTPWEILAAFAEGGDCDDLALWHEWERETRGVRAIRWSKGLHKLVHVEEQTDDELRAVEIGGELVYLFAEGEWYIVSRSRGARARVLDLAESGGTAAVAAFVGQLVSTTRERATVRSPVLIGS